MKFLYLRGSFATTTVSPSANSQITKVVGIQIGDLFSYATSVPFNATTGADGNNDTTVNDRPVGVGRNSERQPSTSWFDLRVSRVFTQRGRQWNF